MTFATFIENQTTWTNGNSNIRIAINDGYVHIVEYADTKPRQGLIISSELLMLIFATGLKEGEYNGNR